jgi:hypothetical protein
MDETTDAVQRRSSGSESAFWHRVGLLIAVWCALLVLAGLLLIFFGDGIMNLLF